MPAKKRPHTKRSDRGKRMPDLRRLERTQPPEDDYLDDEQDLWVFYRDDSPEVPWIGSDRPYPTTLEGVWHNGYKVPPLSRES